MIEERNVLVTGGAGFIGSHVVGKLLERGNTVVCIDNFDNYYSPEFKRYNIAGYLLHPHFKLYQGDVRDYSFLEGIFKSQRFEKIIHLAAKAGVRPSIQNPHLYIETNVQGTTNMLELASEFGIGDIVFASSSSVYGITSKLPFSEHDSFFPISPYAATKLAGEHLCHVYHHLYGLNTTCLRFFTVYGPRGRPDMAIYKFTRAIFEGREIETYGNGSKRDYTYIDDIVCGILSAMDRSLGYEIINLGNSTPVELSRLISIIEEATGEKARIVPSLPQPGDVPITYADLTKAKRLLGYNPKVSIEEGIQKFVAWFKDARRTTGKSAQAV